MGLRGFGRERYLAIPLISKSPNSGNLEEEGRVPLLLKKILKYQCFSYNVNLYLFL